MIDAKIIKSFRELFNPHVEAEFKTLCEELLKRKYAQVSSPKLSDAQLRYLQGEIASLLILKDYTQHLKDSLKHGDDQSL